MLQLLLLLLLLVHYQRNVIENHVAMLLQLCIFYTT